MQIKINMKNKATIVYVSLFIVVLLLLIYLVKTKKLALSLSVAKNGKCKTYIPGKFNFLRTKIWTNVVNKHGVDYACRMFPRTYILPQDLSTFLRDQKENGKNEKQYIAKKLFSGSRVGVDLYDDTTMRQDLYAKKYAVIQEFIKNPLLIAGRKFDVRFYMVVDCRKGIYLYKNSYNVFAEKPFDYYSMDRESKINQANADDDLYVKHQLPRTMGDLKKLQVPYDNILERLAENLRVIINCSELMCNEQDGNKYCMKKKYNVYGVDVEILDDGEFTPLIIEINSSATINFPEVPWKNNLTKAMREKLNVGEYDLNNWIELQTFFLPL
jgi:hypothetical protein